MAKIKKQEALEYHASGRPGKLEVIPTKPYSSQRDLSLAYSPGVAEPCLEIADTPEDVYKYTAKGNLVAVISNGTAVLGLGDIGPMASKPVMEGKGLLFKIFADIDVFDIEVNASDPEDFIRTVKNISPTFGGINLEDIKAPEAFQIEEQLKDELDIPIMHDDQHGTAIIASAALLNALELAEKKIEDVKIVVSGAGAAAISSMQLFVGLGAKLENIVMFDSKGAITLERKDLNERKTKFASNRKIESLGQALENADVFLGLSKGGIVSAEMIKSMAPQPIVFALANPDPEISYDLAIKTRKDIIMATGRSDHPNQVNNVLGFPYIFRGALDVRASKINEEMKLAAVKAIAELARESVPEEVNEAYGLKNITFGRDLIIPKPLDPRLLSSVSSAVAKAAIESGVARATISDWDEYRRSLNERMGRDNKLLRGLSERAKKIKKRVVFAEADNYSVLKAAEMAMEDGIAQPILLGKEWKINKLIEENNLDLEGAEIYSPKSEELRQKREAFAKLFFEKRKRKGITLFEAGKLMRERNYFGGMLVETGEADVLISGNTRSYADVIRPALQIIGKEEGVHRVAGMHIVQTKKGPLFFSDTTVNLDPTAEELAELAILTAANVEKFKIKPKIAFLSYSNFGNAKGYDAEKVAEAVAILHEKRPDLVVDGEMQPSIAMNPKRMKELFPFSPLSNKKANTFIFPNLSSGNIAYQLMQEMTDLEIIGPILLGMRKSFHVLQMGCSVREILNVIKIAVVDAQSK